MKIIFKDNKQYDMGKFKSAVAIGKFDGVHMGHLKLLSAMLPYRDMGFKLAVLTFDKSPAVFFRNENQQGILTEEEKYEKLFEAGVDAVCVYEVNSESMKMEPLDFVKKVLVGTINAGAVCAGYDVSFGNRGKGNYTLLEEAAGVYGFLLKGVDKFKTSEGEIISSTFARKLLNQKDFKQLSDVLGYNYFIRGEVLHGKELGTGIGFPTANINPSVMKLLPEKGVYKTRVFLDGKYYQAVSNLGVRPTVENGGRINLETHIIGYTGNLYGMEIKVEFLVYIRAEKRFESLDELKKQLQDDISTCKSL